MSGRPLFTVVSGAPTEEEVTAVTLAMLTLLRGRAAAGPARSSWSRRSYAPPAAWRTGRDRSPSVR